MIVLKRIIGYETPEIKFKPVNIQDSRPEFCPYCFALAVSDGKFNLVGHGTYRRWVKTPEEFQISIQRFLCKKCRKTCSVFPHWLLPYYQYTAPLILSSLNAFYLKEETASAATKDFFLTAPEYSWSLIHRWAASFLLKTTLWGWLGSALGARKNEHYSRPAVRRNLNRFITHFTDSVLSKKSPSFSSIIDQSLPGRAFSHNESWSLLHTTYERKPSSTPQQSRYLPPTHLTGASRSPP